MVAEVQADHTVIGMQRVRAELVEHFGRDPLIAPRSHVGCWDLTDSRSPWGYGFEPSFAIAGGCVEVSHALVSRVSGPMRYRF
jgi:hypothetical protein